jgi:hypothetical protein
MIKIQVAENTVSLNAKEQDMFFQLLDNNLEFVRYIPTLNALHHWMQELGCRGQVVQSKNDEVEDPWSEKEAFNAQEKLRKLFEDVLSSGYYLGS